MNKQLGILFSISESDTLVRFSGLILIAMCTINHSDPLDFYWAANWIKCAMLNIEGRPSRLPNNSREPNLVVDGVGGLENTNTKASYHHLPYQTPNVLLGPGVEIQSVGCFSLNCIRLIMSECILKTTHKIPHFDWNMVIYKAYLLIAHNTQILSCLGTQYSTLFSAL